MKCIIIGAVAGGASTAARLRRMDEKAEIIIFEKGEHISYANCGLPYYIGDIIKDRNKLFVQNAISFGKRFNIDIRISTEVTSINTSEKTVSVVNLKTGEEYKESYDKLVLSPGAEPIRPPLPGVYLSGIFTLRNVVDTDYIKDYIKQTNPKRAVVIGAGFIGIEMAENLQSLGLEVSIVERSNQILAPVDFPIAAFVQQHIRSKGIDLRLNTTVTGFEERTSHLAVLVENEEAIEADLIILSIGVTPDTRLAAKGGLKIGAAKGIQVNEYLQTSDTDIYAVGDAIEFPNPISLLPTCTYLAGPANKQGRVCANNIAFGNVQKYNGSINTAIVKVFDLIVGSAGLSSKSLETAGISHISSTIHSNSHATYYPGAQLMTIQIVFAPEDGVLFGAQVVGGEGVDKRLDVLSAVIKKKGTIYDLIEFEQAYAPPFSSAKDPVNMAGFVAENILLQRLHTITWKDIPRTGGNGVLIDVRTPSEYNNGTIGDAINIPVDEIRDRLKEIPEDKPIYIFCQQGFRGYLAQRILLQNGFTDVFNLSGGYLLWKICSIEKDHVGKKESGIMV